MNLLLKEIYEQDQSDRENWKEWGKSVPLEEIQKRDKYRLETVLNILTNTNNFDGEDYYHAALILQHSDQLTHYKLANELCTKAITLGEEKAKWLFAATHDRFLMNSGNAFQKFGTQYKKNEKGLWEVYPVDPETSDELRASYNVPSLEKLKAREKELNS